MKMQMVSAHMVMPTNRDWNHRPKSGPSSISIGKIRLIADDRSNTIMVMGPPESITKVDTILEQLDQRPKQVYLAVVIGRLSVGENLDYAIGRSTLDQLGDCLEIAVAATGKLNAYHLVAVIGKVKVNIASTHALRLVIKRNHAIPSQNVIRDDYYPRLSLNATRRFAGNTHYQQSALKS